MKYANGYSVVFTKTAVDGLPITQFKVGEAPCAISTELQANPDDQFYLLERENLKKVTVGMATSAKAGGALCSKSKLTD